MSKFKFLKSPPFFWYNKNLLSKIISYALWPLACVYCLIVMLRKACYRLGILQVKKLPVPVIVVGNITVGGTGKTPLVIWLANFLLEQGWRPGIISRGYGRKSRGVCVVSATMSKPEEVGDEALMIARTTNCPMVVGENRVDSAQKLLATSNCNVIVSDDGLQHLALGRDLEIVVVDGERDLGNGMCLPAGPLRESPSRLQAIDFIIKNFSIKGSEKKLDPERGDKESARRYYAMQFTPQYFCQVGDENMQLSLKDFVESLKGKKCYAVAGIGNPGRFFRELRDLNLSIEEHVFPDHYAYSAADFVFASDDEVIIMTEKDAVKCQSFAKENWWYLKISAKPDDEFVEDFRTSFDACVL